MATYYVRKTGLDANAGTSAGAAWLTIGKALTTMASGDICYIGAGTYSETKDIAASDKTSATRLVGDVDGSHTGDAGEVIVSAWTSGYDQFPATAKTLNLGRFWHLENLTIYGGGNWQSASYACVQLLRDNSIKNCVIAALGDSPAITINNFTTNACNILVEKCHISGMIEACTIAVGAFSGSGDIDTNIIFRNNVISCMTQEFGGILNFDCVSSRKIGGMLVYHNTFLPNTSGVFTVEGASTTFPCIAKYNIIPIGSTTSHGDSNESLYTDIAGSLIVDYNYLYGPDIIVEAWYGSNVTPGTHDVRYADFCFLNWGQRRKYGMSDIREIFGPVDQSPVVRLFNDGSDPVTDDFYGNPRPSGAKTPGAVEIPKRWVKETGTVFSGSNSLSVTGFGWKDIDVEVPSGSSTITCQIRWDSTYTGTKPQMLIKNGGECGVADQTITAVGSANTWEQLTASISTTKAGIVTVRFLSNDTNGAGKAFVDVLNRS